MLCVSVREGGRRGVECPQCSGMAVRLSLGMPHKHNLQHTVSFFALNFPLPSLPLPPSPSPCPSPSPTPASTHANRRANRSNLARRDVRLRAHRQRFHPLRRALAASQLRVRARLDGCVAHGRWRRRRSRRDDGTRVVLVRGQERLRAAPGGDHYWVCGGCRDRQLCGCSVVWRV